MHLFVFKDVGDVSLEELDQVVIGIIIPLCGVGDGLPLFSVKMRHVILQDN